MKEIKSNGLYCFWKVKTGYQAIIFDIFATKFLNTE